MTMFKKMIIAVMCLVGILCFTACTRIDGDLESESKVNKRVAEVVPTERYELVSVEHHDDERPKRDVYTYKSKERDMTFEAVSTLSEVSIDGGVLGYRKSVIVKYDEAVRNQYSEQMDKILSSFDRAEDGRLIYTSFPELDGAADAIAKLSDAYRAELAYNTAEWMVENPLCNISFCHERADYPGYYNPVFTERVDGTLKYDDVYKYITYKHAEAVKNEKIIDFTTPYDQLSRVHVASLTSIIYEGDNLSQRAMEKAREDGLYNNIEYGYYSYYHYPWDSYAIVLDCGLTDDEYAPKWMECYADAFGFECDVQYKKGQVDWTYGGSSYRIVAKDDDNNITDFKIYKDGVDLKIPYITNDDDFSSVGATYVVGIPIDEFAKLFGKEYRIDEDNLCVEFISN